MKLVDVRTITLSCMMGFENILVQMIIMTKQCVVNKNRVVWFIDYAKVCTETLCIHFSETCSVLPVTWSSMLGFKNDVAQMIIITRGCVASKNHLASSKFKVIDHIKLCP